MSYPATVGGRSVEVEPGPEALAIGVESLAYVDIDEVVVEGWSVHLRGPRPTVVIERLGRGRDDFVRALREARLPVRRAAMLQAGTHEPIASYAARRGEQPVVVGLHRDGLTVDAESGPPVLVPLSLVTEVTRDGYELTVHARALPPLRLRHLGRRTDEFLRDLEVARRELASRTREAFTELDPALAGLDAPDGWAVDAVRADHRWGALRDVFAGTDRAAQIAVLEQLAGPALRLGVKAGFAGGTLPFALAPVGGRVAVEGAGSEARATFVFACEDADQVNLALLLTGFRREALFLPEEELGRWAVAARMLEVVRWARSALVARIVHDARWEQRLRVELAGGSGAGRP